MEEKLCQPCEEPVIEQIPPCPLQCGTNSCKSFRRKHPPHLSRKPIIWVLGGPGSHKRPLCQKIAAQYGLIHLSTGDLLRAEIKRDNIRTKCLKSVFARGELVPNDLVLHLLKKAMENSAHGAKGYVIEGFPREKTQGFLFEKNIAPVSQVLYLKMTEQTLTSRLLEKPNPCRDCNIFDTVKGRLKIFFENINKVLDQYPHRLVTIHGEKDLDAVFHDVKQTLEPVIAAVSSQHLREQSNDESLKGV